MIEISKISSHYVFSPEGNLNRLTLGGVIPLAVIIDSLTKPPDFDINPYWQGDFGKVVLQQRRVVAGEFIRRHIDKRFSGWPMLRRLDRALKDLIRAHADLWAAVWHLVEQIHSLSIIAPDQNPSVTFGKLIAEGKLTCPNLSTMGAGSRVTATEAVKNLQSANRQLQQFCNPFDQQVSPETWFFVEQCLRHCDINDSFRVRFWSEMVRRRMLFTQLLGKASPKIFSTYPRKIENRGRKKS